MLVSLAILAIGVQYWYVSRTAPYQQFVAGKEAFRRRDFEAVSTAAEFLRGFPMPVGTRLL